ncbi:MFS transporter [Rhodococcus fascians]|nr:MFS transporter [Rhodococcus fascians]
MTDSTTNRRGREPQPESSLLGGWRFMTGVSLSFVAVSIVGVAVPGIISALAQTLNLSAEAAGLLGSASLWGLATGAIIALPLSGRVPVKPTILILMTICALTEIMCVFVQSYNLLLIMQVVVGIAAGMTASTTGSLFARAQRVELLAGITSAIQTGVASLAFFVLPIVVGVANMAGAWIFLGGCVAAAAIAIFFVFPPIAPVASTDTVETTRTGEVSRPWGVPAVLSIVSIFVFFVGTNAVYQFRVLQGMQNFGMTFESANLALSVTVLFSIAGALVAGNIGVRRGRQLPVIVVGSVLVLSVVMLVGQAPAWMFWLATALYQFSVTYIVIPWQEFQASLDARGRPVVVATFTGYVGIALGGSLGTFLVSRGTAPDGFVDYFPLTVVGVSCIGLGVILFLGGVVAWRSAARGAGETSSGTKNEESNVLMPALNERNA